MKKKLSKIFSYFMLAATVISLAVINVNAEEASGAAGYDKSFSYNGNVQTYTVPVSGYYKLEVWGAEGGDGGAQNVVSGDRIKGGNGGYSVGYMLLNAGDQLNVCIGGAGKVPRSALKVDEGNWEETVWKFYDVRVAGGYNGGGYGGTWFNQLWDDGDGWDMYQGSGGGATHIALGPNRGVLANYSSHRSEVLIVAGGGGGLSCTPNDEYTSYVYKAGAGGGLSGGTAPDFWGKNGVAADQNGGFKFGVGADFAADMQDKSHTANEVEKAGGGGGGWFGGYNGSGGSGYIGGCLSTLEYRGSTYTSSTAAGNNSGDGKAAITYLGPVCYRQTVQVSYENADGTFTEYEDAVAEDLEEGSTFTWKREADSIYQETDEISYTVTEAKTTQVTVYRQQYKLTLKKTNGIDTVTGEGEYRAGQTVNIEATVKEGYEFGGWSDSETFIGTESTYEFEMPANDLSYTAVTVPVEYSITYYLQGGADGGKNPEGYTAESENIVLKEPAKEGYNFLGWSESSGSSYQKNVTIPKGSTGDKVYWANWEKDIPEDDNDQGNGPDGGSGDGSEDEGVILPSPTLTPVPTLKRTPADDGSKTADEEAETEEPKLIQMPSADHAAPAPVIKEEGSINIPEKNVGVSKSDRSDNSFWKITAAVAGVGIIGGTMILFVLFWFSRKCKIYDARTEEVIGRTVIRKNRRGMYWVRISDAVYEMAGTRIYIVPGENFVRSYPEKLIKISICGKEFYRQIQEKIDLQHE